MARLAARFAGRFSAQTVQAVLADSYRRLAETATVTAYLPVLAERFTAERLEALAHVRAPRGARKLPRVLFVCSRNAGRSQLAAALLRHRAGDRVTVSCAGTRPAARIEPYVAQVLIEAGAAPTAAYPKPLADEVVAAADVVITMGCGDACPVLFGKTYLDWPVPDPADAPIAVVRRIRDDINTRVTALLDRLPSTSTPIPPASAS
ncbi:arsenate reductase ArsC [Streptomyces typhae]|uniref:arsenate reductase ArsC n=1 Tax=Streptomyces typhae TaxID=2681492 RepID=UPI0031B598F9